MHTHSTISRLKVYLCVLVVLSTLLYAAHNATAHALLVRSLPEANAELASAPAQIEFWFSEPLEATVSHAYLIDAAGNELARGGSTVDAVDPTHMTLEVPPLEPGIYTVVYRTLSQADGHEWLGSFPLTLLNPDGSRPAGAAPAVESTQSNTLPTPFEVVSRWFSLMGALLAFGAVCFRQIVAPTNLSAFRTAAGRSLWLGLFSGVALLFMGSWLQLGALKLALAESEWGTLLLETRGGNLLLLRQLLALLLLAWYMCPAFGDADSRRAASVPSGRLLGQGIQLAVGVAILATFSFGSHAAAVPGKYWAMLGDLIHVAAAAIWMGGLLLLAALLWQTRQLGASNELLALQQTVRRFSTTAFMAMFVLICSGLFSSVVQLPALELLWSTPYGWLLIGKVALVCIVLAIAFLNHRFARGQSALHNAKQGASHGAPSALSRFRRQVWIETFAAVGIMVVVAALVQTPVPPPTATAEPDYFSTILSADDLMMHFQISPNQLGENEYIAHLYHEDNSPIGEVQMVRLSFVHQTAELGQANLELTDQGGALFSAKGAYQNRAGPWDITLYVRRRGMDDLLTTTTVETPAPGGAGAAADPWQNPVRAVAPGLLPTGIIGALLLLQLILYGRKP